MGAITFQQAFALAYGKYKDPGTGVTTTFTPPASLGNLLNGKPFLQASAALPGSITIPAGASFTIGKKTIKLPQTNASSLHFHGNPRIKAFFTDLFSGTDSLDIVFVGDSNINYAQSGSYGYVQGFANVLKSNNIPVYATPLFITSGGSDVPAPSLVIYELGIANNLSYIGNPLVTWPAQLTKGSASIYTEITEKWNKGFVSLNKLTPYSASKAYTIGEEISFSGQGYFCIQNTTAGTQPTGNVNDPFWNLITFQYMGTGADIDWVAAVGNNLTGGFFSSVFSVGNQPSGVGAPDYFGRSGTINWRIGYATFPNSPNGRFTGVAYTVSPTTIRGEVTFSTNRASGDPVYKVGVIPLNLGATAVTEITFNKYYHGSDTAKLNTPYGFLFESAVKANTKGFAVNTLISSPGDQLNRRIKKPLVNTKLSTTSVFLKEIRERQIACGGTGRVMIFINAGVNGNESAANWEQGLNESISAIKEAWAFNGFPENDIQFVVTASARTLASYQSSTYTNAVGQHNKGIDIASKFFNIAFVNIYEGFDIAAMGTLWDGTNPDTLSVHLNANGYVTISQFVVDQCRNIVSIKDISTDGGDINHNGKWIQAEKNYHDTGKPYFYGFLKKK